MDLIHLSKDARHLTYTGQILAQEKPVLLYLGCLHHVQDIDTAAPAFFSYMSQLSGGKDVYTVMPVDTQTSFDDLMKIRKDFNDGLIRPSGLARYIFDNIFAPVIDASSDLNEPQGLARLKTALSRISIFGYSYGTSLMQQIGVCMTDHLSGKLDDDASRTGKIFEACQAIKAVTIGPVARPYHLHADGSTSPLRYDAPDFTTAATIFTQASFLMRADKIVQRAYGDECLGGKDTSATGIEIRETRSLKLVIDYTEIPKRLAAGFREAAAGEYVPEIMDLTDPAVHHPRLYTNMSERVANMRVFPSIAVSPIIRKALVTMLEPAKDAKTWLENSVGPIEPEQNRLNLVRDFEAARSHFIQSSNQSRAMTSPDAGQFLKHLVEASP